MAKKWQVWTEENKDYFNVKFEGSQRECNHFYHAHGGSRNGYHIGYDISDNTFFDDHGNFIALLPEDCVIECTLPGQDASEAVKRWTLALEFSLPSLKAGRKFLSEFGTWEDLESADMFTLSQRVLWLACGEIKESGEWFGLVS